ncbi:DUF2207 domain-containing protein [Amycolatopsis suaedae]|uniref:DUF2207 domain-containing protein n=1 Tax=Amycolatopsis suaedae TaxID=2510978 RepID=A0A4Q7J7H7_9PSEU|nr:DUF2207 domain-containing protein [Amycolatopsis suaedae]
MTVLTGAAAHAQSSIPDGPEGGPSVESAPPDLPVPSRPDEAVGRQPAPGGLSVDVAFKVGRDGTLAVTETITVPGAQQLERTANLRVPNDDETDRVYTVRDVTAEGAGSAEADGETLRVRAGQGTTTVRYVVEGAVADTAGQQEVRWPSVSGWNHVLPAVTGSFVAPVQQTSSVRCLAGPPGSGLQCALAEVDHSGVIRFAHSGLEPGQRIELAVTLPAGTAPATARFADVPGLANAFDFTVPAAIGLGVAALGILGWFGYLLVARRRDSGAVAAPAARLEVLLREGDRVYFASPDGILPGQVGTVIDGTVDVVDVSATVVDLAVRNYLWVAPVRDADGVTDWRLARRNPPDDDLHPYERAVYEALLPGGTDAVLLSELRSRGVDLSAADTALYADVVHRRWFSRHPGAAWSAGTWIGAALALAGVAATVVLALTVGHALAGVAVVLAGIAVAAGSILLPARTARGRALVPQVRGLAEYLHTVSPDDVPAADRELVFSRSLPYAVVLGETEGWLGRFARLDPTADGAGGLYWFGGLESDRDLRRLGTHLPALLTTLDGVLAESAHLRSLR